MPTKREHQIREYINEKEESDIRSIGKIEYTQRGFQVIEFQDSYGISCNIQESSSVEPHIWLGVKDLKPEIMGKKGWETFEVPDGVLFHNRMHLNREHASGLVEVLQNWLKSFQF